MVFDRETYATSTVLSRTLHEADLQSKHAPRARAQNLKRAIATADRPTGHRKVHLSETVTMGRPCVEDA